MRNRWMAIVVVLIVVVGGWFGWQAKRRHDQTNYVATQRELAPGVRVSVDAPQRMLTARSGDGHIQQVDLARLDMVMVHEQVGDNGLALLTFQTKNRLVSLPYYGLDAWRVVQQLPPLLAGLDPDVAAAQLSRFENEREVVCVLWASPAQEGLLEKAGHLAGHCWQRPES